MEFQVNSIDYAISQVSVLGRNYGCDISVGDIFHWAYRITSDHIGGNWHSSYSNERSVTLFIKAIEVYLQDTDTLSVGMSGRLTLTGEGINTLQPAASGAPFSYDLLRSEKHVMPRRPIGLAEGEFVIPDDFDEPLPEELQRLFDGHSDKWAWLEETRIGNPGLLKSGCPPSWT